MRYDGRIVHQHIDLAEAINHFVDHRLNAVFIAHVDVDGQSLGRMPDLRRRLSRQIVIDVGNDNFGFLLRESFRRVLADTLPASRNNDNFPLQHDLTSQNVRQFYMERLSQSRNGFKRRYNGLVFSVLGLALRD